MKAEVSRCYTRAVNQIAERITIDPEQCGGRPCVRGMRIRVSDVVDLFASGLTAEEILEEMPDLEPEDLQACLRSRCQAMITAAAEAEHPETARPRNLETQQLSIHFAASQSPFAAFAEHFAR